MTGEVDPEQIRKINKQHLKSHGLWARGEQMPEPTIDEMLEWIDAEIGPERWSRGYEVGRAIRAILEQHRNLRWRDSRVDPLPEGSNTCLWHCGEKADYWIPMSALPALPEEKEKGREQ